MADKKRILIFGDEGYDMVSEQLAGVFREMGYEAERFFISALAKNWASFLYKFFVRTPLIISTLKLQYAYKNFLGELYLKKIRSFKPDLLFIVHFNSVSPQAIKHVRDHYKIPVAWWVMADAANVSRFDPFLVDLYSNCSHLFFADESWLSTIKLLGEAKLSYLPFAADPRLYYPTNQEKKYDVSIVANFTSNSPTIIHKGLILDRLCREGFKIRAVARGIKKLFGEFPALKKLDLVDEFYLPPAVNELYNQSKIMLAVNNPQAKSDPAVRVMEIAASQNFQLAEYRENTKKLMGETVVEFNSLDDLVEKAKFYLSNEEERKRLAKASYELVLEKHTVKIRAEQALKEIYAS